jgi:hypothetical protein
MNDCVLIRSDGGALVRAIVSVFSIALIACGATVEVPEPDAGPGCLHVTDCPSSTACLVFRCSEAGLCEGIVPSNPECHDGGSDPGGMCDPLVPRSTATPNGCCPTGCAPLDTPTSGPPPVYCVDVVTGGAC